MYIIIAGEHLNHCEQLVYKNILYRLTTLPVILFRLLLVIDIVFQQWGLWRSGEQISGDEYSFKPPVVNRNEFIKSPI